MFSDHPHAGFTAGFTATPAEIVKAVPEALGYHPTGDLVILGYHHDDIHATVAIDLRNPPAVQLDMARYAVSVLGRAGLTHCAIVAFGEPDHHTLCRLVDGLADYGVAVPYTIRAVNDRVHSCLLRDHPPASDQATVAASLEPVDAYAQKAMRAATRTALRLIAGAYRVAGWRAREDHRHASYRFLRQSADRYAAGGTLTDLEAAMLSVQLQDPRITNEAASLIDHCGRRAAHLALWADLARRANSLFRARPLALYAYAAWHDGDRSRAVHALKRARACDPSDELTAAIAHAVASGHPPRELRITPPTERHPGHKAQPNGAPSGDAPSGDPPSGHASASDNGHDSADQDR